MILQHPGCYGDIANLAGLIDEVGNGDGHIPHWSGHIRQALKIADGLIQDLHSGGDEIEGSGRSHL